MIKAIRLRIYSRHNIERASRAASLPVHPSYSTVRASFLASRARHIQSNSLRRRWGLPEHGFLNLLGMPGGRNPFTSADTHVQSWSRPEQISIKKCIPHKRESDPAKSSLCSPSNEYLVLLNLGQEADVWGGWLKERRKSWPR